MVTEEEIDKILDKNAKKFMKVWNLKGFKRTFPSLYKVIINSINEIINKNIK